MTGRIFHISTDNKFVNNARYQFDKIFPDKNLYKIFVFRDTKELKYIDNIDESVQIISTNNIDYGTILNDIKKNDLVVLHGLNPVNSKIVLNYYTKLRFLWLFWGAEIYNHPSQPLGDFYGTKTRKTFKIKTTSNIFINTARNIYYKLRYRIDYYENLKAAKKIDYFANFNPHIYKLFKKKGLLKKDTRLINYLYYPLEYMFNDVGDLRVNKNNILIGNSAYPSLNHLEVFDLIRDFQLDNLKIMVPLSYGDNKYGEKIKDIGKQIFNDKISYLEEFMSLGAYNKIIQNYGIAIFNNYRMQSNGNIYTLLWMGAKVYLSERNITLKHLKELGIKIYSIEKDLVKENKDKFQLLSEREVKENRMILKKYMSEDVVLPLLKNQIQDIFSEIK